MARLFVTGHRPRGLLLRCTRTYATGVRIEDLVVVCADGHETLTGLPTELTVVA